MKIDCFECGATVGADDLDTLAEEFRVHARAEHDWPYSDQAIRNYAYATERLTGPSERLPEIGPVEVHPVTEERLDDWLAFFDHDAFVGKPEWAACYCLEPHVGFTEGEEVPHWRENRQAMEDRLRSAKAFGYLAYVEGRAAGWVNASKRSDYALFRVEDGPAGEEVVGVSCFVIAPPYRRHGVAAALLDAVIADAPRRGAAWVEAYPFNEQAADDASNFRGGRSMYEARGFEPVTVGEKATVMRRPVP